MMNSAILGWKLHWNSLVLSTDSLDLNLHFLRSLDLNCHHILDLHYCLPLVAAEVVEAGVASVVEIAVASVVEIDLGSSADNLHHVCLVCFSEDSASDTHPLVDLCIPNHLNNLGNCCHG
jgi:hypothetical protein